MKKVYNAPLTEEFKMKAVGTICTGSPKTIPFGSGDWENTFE